MGANRIILAVTGASGAIYAQGLLRLLSQNACFDEIALVFSENGRAVWIHELGKIPQFENKVRLANNDNMFDAIASGSAGYNTMVVVPCSMGTLGRIAHGTSDSLICRAADVMLKERRKLVLVTRETPLSLIHIENMRAVTLAGAFVCPASPSFYSKPQSIDDAAQTVVQRVLDLVGVEGQFFRWGGSSL